MTPTGFLNQIVDLVTPTQDARSLVALHRARVEEHLTRDLRIIRMRETGSWNHGTALKGVSDVDYFVTMPGSPPRWSSDAIALLHGSLRRGFPTSTTYTDRPAVAFRPSPDVPTLEIVPVYVRASDDYDIPDPTGVGWIRSNPVKHLEYVSRAQQRDDRAKNLVRLIKTWRFFNSVPVSSIYLEMRTAKRVLDVPPVIFLHDIAAVMRDIADGGLAAMNDPSDYDGRRIGPGCKDASEHASALAAFKVAAQLATLARDAASAGDNAMACNYLSRLFAIRSN